MGCLPSCCGRLHLRRTSPNVAEPAVFELVRVCIMVTGVVRMGWCSCSCYRRCWHASACVRAHMGALVGARICSVWCRLSVAIVANVMVLRCLFVLGVVVVVFVEWIE